MSLHPAPALSLFETSARPLANRKPALTASAWEKEVAALPHFTRVSCEDYGALARLLQNERDADGALTSPVYYSFTGRKGLWVYKRGDAFVLLCWHPNGENQLLIFPPRGNPASDVMTSLWKELPVPQGGLRLARVKEGEDRARWLSEQGPYFEATPVVEDVLDWRYPVRVLSTEKTRALAGGAFAKTRSHIKQLEKQGIETAPFTQDMVAQVMDFLFRWATAKARARSEIAELLAPYEELMRLHKEGFALEGLVFRMGGVIEAFTMWEPAQGDTKMANAWVTIANRSHNALSDLVIRTLAETLFRQGVPYLNIGGSEMKSLDDFKKKFPLAYSLPLYSMDITLAAHLATCDFPLPETKVA